MTNQPHYLERLRTSGLRLTEPRTNIARLLFEDGAARHVTAEWIADELAGAGTQVSTGTIYNTLRLFLDRGWLREVHGTSGSAVIFDTNLRPHHHIYDEGTGQLSDVTGVDLDVSGDIKLPRGKSITGYDVVIRVR
ncbi:MAG: transcriptional repressor [Henriciella sp.]|nr:transcriptional repressor [Henriciella sp.]